MHVIKAATATIPPTTPAMIGTKEPPPDSGLGVDDGEGVVPPKRPDVCCCSGCVVTEGISPTEVEAGAGTAWTNPPGKDTTAYVEKCGRLMLIALLKVASLLCLKSQRAFVSL